MLAPIAFGLILGGKKTKNYGFAIKWAFKWNPTFCFSMGLTQVALGNIIYPDEKQLGIGKAGADIVALIVFWFIYFILILFIENKWFINRHGVARKLNQNNQEVNQDFDDESNDVDILDSDVKEEEQRVANLSPDELEIRTYLLNKIYKDRRITKHAVRNVSFGVSFGE